MHIDKILDPLSAIHNCIDFHGRYILIGHHAYAFDCFYSPERRVLVRDKIKINFANANTYIVALVAFYICAIGVPKMYGESVTIKVRYPWIPYGQSLKIVRHLQQGKRS